MTVLHHLRQQTPKPNDEDPNYCLADFIAPPGHADYIGGFAVTAGNEIEHLLSEYDDDYSKIMIQALADRLAEASAEAIHKHVRTEAWGYSENEALDHEALIKEKYQVEPLRVPKDIVASWLTTKLNGKRQKAIIKEVT